MTYILRTFKHLPTGEVYEVAVSENYLPPLRRRIVKECDGAPEWESESVFQHQVGLDITRDGDIDRPLVEKR
jgi:hypothetical protein